MQTAFLIPSIVRHEKDMKLLTRLVESISKHEPEMLPHCLVVDDASTFKGAKSFYDSMENKYSIKVLYKPEQHSYSSMINFALKHIIKTGYEYFATVNNDIELCSPIVKKLTDCFSISGRIVAVGPLLLFPTGKVQSAGFEVNMYGEPHEYDRHQYYVPNPHLAYNQPRCVQGVTGAFQMLKTSSFIRVGGYNENYLMGFEDVEFCLRTWLKGGWVFYQPNAVAIHCESVTRGRVPCARQMQSVERVSRDITEIDLDSINERIEQANKSLGLITNDREQEEVEERLWN